MNFLAHARLSFGDPAILVGDMISDFVKGRKQYDYASDIFTGIRLHRAIDEFTDNHEATASAKQYFRGQYRLYAGAFVDVVYDHFLANDINEFATPQQLQTFTATTYQQLAQQLPLLPFSFQQLFPYMREQDWLYNYRYEPGIRKSFNGLVRRSRYLKESEIAFDIFQKEYSRLEECYVNFFPAVKKFAAAYLQQPVTT